MGEKKYLQEFECDWIANIEGAVYGDVVTKMEDARQLTRVPYDPSLPVSTAWDLGVSVSVDFLRQECQKATELPAYENTFRQLYLNQWTEQDTRWLRMDAWARGGQACPVTLQGRECWAGLDLATTFDTTAFVLVFPLEDGRYWVEPHFWIPEENMRERVRRDKVPYDVWARQEHLHLTPGNVTDFDQVRADINTLAKKYNIRQVGIDRWNATQLANQLQGDGVNVLGYGQGYGAQKQQERQEQMAEDQKASYNRNIGTRLWG